MDGPSDPWADWLRAANAGDAAAYRRFLEAVTPHLRAASRRQLARLGGAREDAEDAVQDALLAIHLKRGTWDDSRAVRPWLAAILRNKLIDVLRRRGRAVMTPLDDILESLGAEDREEAASHLDLARMMGGLKARQREIVQAISLDGASVRATAERLAMTEVAVRVALHRAIRSMAAAVRKEAS